MPVQASVSSHSIMRAQYEAEFTSAPAALPQLYSRLLRVLTRLAAASSQPMYPAKAAVLCKHAGLSR